MCDLASAPTLSVILGTSEAVGWVEGAAVGYACFDGTVCDGGFYGQVSGGRVEITTEILVGTGVACQGTNFSADDGGCD